MVHRLSGVRSGAGSYALTLEPMPSVTQKHIQEISRIRFVRMRQTSDILQLNVRHDRTIISVK